MRRENLFLNKTMMLLIYFIISYLSTVVVFYLAYTVRIFMEKMLWLPNLNQDIGYYLKFVNIFWFILLLIYAYENIFFIRNLLWCELKKILSSTTVVFLLFVFYFVIYRESYDFSKVIIVFIFIFSLIIFPLIHYLARLIFKKLNIYNIPIILIGDYKSLSLLYKLFNENSYLGYTVIGYFGEKVDDLNCLFLGEYKDSFDYLSKNNFCVVVTVYDKDRPDVMNRLQKIVKKLFIFYDINVLNLFNSEILYFLGQDYFVVKFKNSLNNLYDRLLKIIFDYSVSIFLLPFLLVLIFLIGIAIKLDSKGKVFYKHKRIGKNGKVINVIKFRTMYENSEELLTELLNKNADLAKEWYETYKLKNDPRVTKVGKFLRKTSLDELPQIFNVLKGEMSLVGHRPVTKEELDLYYNDVLEYYMMVKPGITGLWQVTGRNDVDYSKRVMLDMWYLFNWSLWLDIVIIIKTIGAIIYGKGAY